MRSADSARTTALRLVLAGIAVALAAGGFASVAAEPAEPSLLRVAQRAAADDDGPPYRLRCWQFGRLIADEVLAGPPAELDASSAKIRALDRSRQPIYVTETRNATCVIQARRDAPRVPPGLPR